MQLDMGPKKKTSIPVGRQKEAFTEFRTQDLVRSFIVGVKLNDGVKDA